MLVDTRNTPSEALRGHDFISAVRIREAEFRVVAQFGVSTSAYDRFAMNFMAASRLFLSDWVRLARDPRPQGVLASAARSVLHSMPGLLVPMDNSQRSARE